MNDTSVVTVRSLEKERVDMINVLFKRILQCGCQNQDMQSLMTLPLKSVVGDHVT